MYDGASAPAFTKLFYTSIAHRVYEKAANYGKSNVLPKETSASLAARDSHASVLPDYFQRQETTALSVGYPGGAILVKQLVQGFIIDWIGSS